jgi:hypothetical protein
MEKRRSPFYESAALRFIGRWSSSLRKLKREVDTVTLRRGTDVSYFYICTWSMEQKAPVHGSGWLTADVLP